MACGVDIIARMCVCAYVHLMPSVEQTFGGKGGAVIH